MFFKLISILAVTAGLGMTHARAATHGLVIHSEEFGVGKFHRLDNKNHPYEKASAWFPYVLPDNARTDVRTLTRDNADGSVTVVFSTLEDLVTTVIDLSHERHELVSVLNVHGHGLPGGMWFPKDAKTLESLECYDWQNAATGSDEANYGQYYSPVSVEDVRSIRQMSDAASPGLFGCITGLSAWSEVVERHPEFKAVLSGDVQLHFLSCVVGLGRAGETFTKGLAALLLAPGSDGRIETSVNFGLGDWSMPEGMGFWDYLNDAQIDHDNSVYPIDRKDREIAQKGTIRLVRSSADGQWSSVLLAGREFMSLGFERGVEGDVVSEPSPRVARPAVEHGRVRVPGTNAFVSWWK